MKYVQPEMEVVFFKEETIVRTSNPDNDVKLVDPGDEW